MKILVFLEHDGAEIRQASLSALSFANSLVSEAGGEVHFLLVGSGLDSIAKQASAFAPVICIDDTKLAQPIAERYAPVLADCIQAQTADAFVAASTTRAKDIVGRAAGLLGGTMASDVVGHRWQNGELQLERPIFAGSAVATVVLEGSPKIITVQACAYEPAKPTETTHEVVSVTAEHVEIRDRVQLVHVETRTQSRPDVTEASVVVSGGRALKNSDDFERLVGGLADVLHGGTGSSRALVDAGITPNELQVGQTGKIIAPDVYVALGISGAVQHLAGMKNSKTVVAVNSDPDAPIFEEADYGFVGDVYEVVPQLIQRLQG